MSKFSVIVVAPGKTDPPFNPYVYILLSECFRDSDGNITLSPKLMTDIEVDESVDLLIGQLQKARNKAKRELQKAKSKRT